MAKKKKPAHKKKKHHKLKPKHSPKPKKSPRRATLFMDDSIIAAEQPDSPSGGGG
jgi:hypothetical protein